MIAAVDRPASGSHAAARPETASSVWRVALTSLRIWNTCTSPGRGRRYQPSNPQLLSQTAIHDAAPTSSALCLQPDRLLSSPAGRISGPVVNSSPARQSLNWPAPVSMFSRQHAAVRVVSVNNVRNTSVPAVYHAAVGCVPSAKQRKDHLIHRGSHQQHTDNQDAQHDPRSTNVRTRLDVQERLYRPKTNPRRNLIDWRHRCAEAKPLLFLARAAPRFGNQLTSDSTPKLELSSATTHPNYSALRRIASKP